MRRHTHAHTHTLDRASLHFCSPCCYTQRYVSHAGADNVPVPLNGCSPLPCALQQCEHTGGTRKRVQGSDRAVPGVDARRASVHCSKQHQEGGRGGGDSQALHRRREGVSEYLSESHLRKTTRCISPGVSPCLCEAHRKSSLVWTARAPSCMGGTRHHDDTIPCSMVVL